VPPDEEPFGFAAQYAQPGRASLPSPIAGLLLMKADRCGSSTIFFCARKLPAWSRQRYTPGFIRLPEASR